jgi:AcrR family transcriptional regulator
MAAAGDLFAEHGYHATTIDAVVERAGFTRGAFYAHFADKADLFSTLLESAGHDDLEEIQEALADKVGDDAFTLLQEHFDRIQLDSRWRLAHDEFWPIAVRDPALKARLHARHEFNRSIIASMVDHFCTDAGLELPIPVEQVAALMLALADGISHQAYIDPSPLPDDAFGTAVALLWGGLLGSHG